jgi:group I intron endonuclease
MTGIYKITCLKTKKVYIGQSVNVQKRIKEYKRLSNCSSQIKLFNSLKKHGIGGHKFEVLTECDQSELNKWERYYQDLYHCLGPKGLNLIATGYKDRCGEASTETKARISAAGTGRKNSVETIEKMRKSALLRDPKTQETLDKIRNTRIERNYPAWNKGIPRTDEVKAKLKSARTGKRCGADHPRKRMVINLETGIFFDTTKDAAFYSGINYSTLNAYLKGVIPNKTSLIYA